VAIIVALTTLGLDIGPLLAGLGVVGIAIGFGAQSVVRDVISGIFFLMEDAFRVGEYIDTGRLRGTVEGMSLRSVRLRHPERAGAHDPVWAIVGTRTMLQWPRSPRSHPRNPRLSNSVCWLLAENAGAMAREAGDGRHRPGMRAPHPTGAGRSGPARPQTFRMRSIVSTGTL
jgi:hypothetical protein